MKRPPNVSVTVQLLLLVLLLVGWNNKRTKFCLARNDAVADPARVDIAVGVCVCVCMRETERVNTTCLPFL